jgi:hypothetical protein
LRCSSLALLCGLMLANAAWAQPAGPADPAPVIAAERAFAARAGEVGVAPSFTEFSAPDAIVFAPDPAPAHALYAGRPRGKTPKEGGTLLAWWPNWAGIARSGDLGFTTGPAEVNGKRSVHYFTVWARQADGGWKWIYDGGADSDPSRAPGREAPVKALPPGDAQAIPAATAMAQVQAAEKRLATAAMRDSRAAYKAALAQDARVQGSAMAPATDPAAVDKELATRASVIAFSPIGGSASRAGDLAWTYGDAIWGERRGHYVRIWQRRAGAWKLVFDQILATPPPPEPPKS